MKKKLLLIITLSFFVVQLFASSEETNKVKKLKNKFSTTKTIGNFNQTKIITYLYNIDIFGSDKSAVIDTDSIPESKTEFEKNGNAIEGITFFWENDKWNKNIKIISYTRSETSIDSTIVFEYDKITTSWKLQGKIISEYDANGLKKQLFHLADSLTGALNLFLKTEFNYNNNGYLISELSDIYVADSGKYFPILKEEYFVDESGVQDSSISSMYLRGEGANFWMSMNKIYFYYKENGTPDFEVNYDWNYISWGKSTKTNYLFNDDDDIYFETDSAWTGVNWIPSSTNSTTYHDVREPLVDIYSLWVDSQNKFLVHDKTYYFYEPNTSVITNIIDKNYSVFPNPASDFITIKIEKPKNASFKLYDITGKMVLQNNLNSPSSTFSVAKFKKGNYVAKIKNNNKTQTQIIIIK